MSDAHRALKNRNLSSQEASLRNLRAETGARGFKAGLFSDSGRRDSCPQSIHKVDGVVKRPSNFVSILCLCVTSMYCVYLLFMFVCCMWFMVFVVFAR